MARDHARIHLDIWGDDDWLDLPVDAQLLYLTLYTSPGRTLCGAHEWNPAKLAQRAGDWTVGRIEAAAAILSQQLFLIIDTDTGECLLRSWIKHDGLWRTPNMAVSVANARANLASRTLRGVIVHEVLKLQAAEPDSSSWQRDAVLNMLCQKAVDPATLDPFDPGPNGGGNPAPNGGSDPSSNGAAKGYREVGAKGGSNGGPTNAIAIPTAIRKGGYVGRERHLAPVADEPNAPPPNRCPEHIDVASPPPCGACADARRRVERFERDRKTARRRAIDACPLCDDNGMREVAPGQIARCTHEVAEERHA